MAGSEATTPEWVAVRTKVKRFVEDRVYPAEETLDNGTADEARAVLHELMKEAKAQNIWALGHPVEIGGQGMKFMDYVYINEVIGRSQHAQVALGTHSLQDSIMLNMYAWVIRGRKWFTTGAAGAAYTTVMCRTEPEGTPSHAAFSMIVVPTNTPGYRIIRDTPVLGLKHGTSGHYEVAYDEVRVPAENLLGPRGAGFLIAQKRLGPGRIFHCMRWLGQAQRAFDLMCRRLHERHSVKSWPTSN